MPLSRLTALSPLDGRYAEQVQDLAAVFSECGLMRHRVAVEVEYFIALCGWLKRPVAADSGVRRALRALYVSFSEQDAAAIKEIESRTRHDLKAVEYWLKERIAAIPGLEAERELVHFALTSEDVNNLAYALMHQGAWRFPLGVQLARVLDALSERARSYRSVPMLARTHGQPASPTTMGKEIGVFASRLAHEAEDLVGYAFPGKLYGATGTLAAHAFAYPDEPWMAHSRGFVAGLGLRPVTTTTQVEASDGLAAFYDGLRRVNHVLLDACQDMWRYISDDYFRQRVVAGEVGSSAMPHKVNPIDFENAEGNLGLANALLGHLGDKLTQSRLQRDLSGSTVIRNAGVALAHTLLGWRSFLKGLERVELDPERVAADLAGHPEVIAEAIQTLLRAQGGEVPYERLMALTRGRSVTLEELREAARALAPDLAERWDALSPATYIGLAPSFADEAAHEAHVIARFLDDEVQQAGRDLLGSLAYLSE